MQVMDLNPEHRQRIVGVDPGDKRSAYVLLVDGYPSEHGWTQNETLLQMLSEDYVGFGILAIETLHPRGELASRQAMETQLWAGRFIQATVKASGGQRRFIQVAEYDSRCAVTGRTNATNAQVRQALLDKFGDTRQEPCGNCHSGGVVMGTRGPKKCPCCKGRKYLRLPGPLDGFNEHERSAIAAGLYYWQQLEDRRATA